MLRRSPPHESDLLIRIASFQILCALLNRIENFTAPWGSLIYMNWYVGETATAVIVANVPHLWPLISRIFHLGAFKQPSHGANSNQYALKTRGGVGPGTVRRRNYDKDGYVRSESEERIATGDTQWGHSKTSGSEGDLELGGYSVTVAGGGVRDAEELAWTDRPVDPKDQIIKTVQMKQSTHEG